MKITYKENTAFIGLELFGETVWFRNTRSTDLDARLLAEKLDGDFRNKVESARREAYNSGYKDAKSKKKKQYWFRGLIE